MRIAEIVSRDNELFEQITSKSFEGKDFDVKDEKEKSEVVCNFTKKSADRK